MERTTEWMLGCITAALAGMYGFFLKHIYNHVTPEKLKEKQDLASCREIVKRLDENHKELCNKIDNIITRLDKYFDQHI